MFNLHFFPLELAVCVCKWASTMILLFNIWMENVVYHDGEKVSSLSGQYVNGEGTNVYISRLSSQLEAQEDKHSYHYC